MIGRSPAGYQPVLLTPGGKDAVLFNHVDKGRTAHADGDVAGADPDSFAAVVLPGGVVGSDTLRTDESVLSFVSSFATTGRPLAVVCHAPWILLEAGLVDGRRVTSYPSLATDLRNAGAEWVDEAPVVDGNLVTARNPADLEDFSKALLDRLNPATA